jgi:UDP-N-acetyl-D-glucosamine dehydrogenase
MRIGIVGMGYVGLPLAVAFANEGHEVVGFDVDAGKVASLRAGRSYVGDVSDEVLAAVASRITPTVDSTELAGADAIIICVPTPLTPNREPDLRPLIDAGNRIGAVLVPGQLVVLESTTFPGTTRDLLRGRLEAAGLRAGEDFYLAFSPERVDPGRADYTLRTTPKVVGGLTPACGDRAEALYREVCDRIVRVSSPEAAELSKLLENIFRSVNIALVNEMWMLADRMGIDIREVVDAAATKPFGFMRFDPGPGMGGHCLPVDPFYLSWKAREHDVVTEFIELAGKVNQHMPYFCFDRIQRALDADAKPVRGSRVLLLGVSYKAGVGDLRESPALKILSLLRERRADVAYHDPHVPELGDLGLVSQPLDAVDGADLVVIVTAHPQVDHADVALRATRLVDLRGAVHAVQAPAIVRP